MRDLPFSSLSVVHLGVAPETMVASSCVRRDFGHRVEGLLGPRVAGSEAQEDAGSTLKHSQAVSEAEDALGTDSRKAAPQELFGPSQYLLSLHAHVLDCHRPSCVQIGRLLRGGVRARAHCDS